MEEFRRKEFFSDGDCDSCSFLRLIPGKVEPLFGTLENLVTFNATPSLEQYF